VPRQSPRAEYEPKGKLLGQCHGRVALQQLEEGAHQEAIYPSCDVALADIADYVDPFYNSTRWHSHLDGFSPEEVEAAHKPGRRCASGK
jgi:hypothetical protein